MRYAVSAVLLVLVSSLLTSCASMSDVVDSKKDGTAMTYAIDQKRAWEITETILRWEGVEDIQDHKSENYILGSTGMNLVSYGSVVGVWVEPVSGGSMRVTVVSKRKVATGLVSGMKESTFHEYFKYALGQVKAGKPLPDSAPLLDEN
jgi:hypothetical protein